MRNLTDHRIDGAENVGQRGVELVRCTCSVRWMTTTEFTLHIAEVAADTAEQRVRHLEAEARRQMIAANDALTRAKTFAIQAKASEIMAEHSARLATQAAQSSWARATEKPKRKWWQA